MASACRVTFVTHCSALYGANRSLLALIDGLREYGVAAQVLCPIRGEIVRALTDRAANVQVVPFHWWFSWNRRWREVVWRLCRNIRAIPHIVGNLSAWKADVVYTNSTITPVGAMAARRLAVSVKPPAR